MRFATSTDTKGRKQPRQRAKPATAKPAKPSECRTARTTAAPPNGAAFAELVGKSPTPDGAAPAATTTDPRGADLGGAIAPSTDPIGNDLDVRDFAGGSLRRTLPRATT